MGVQVRITQGSRFVSSVSAIGPSAWHSGMVCDVVPATGHRAVGRLGRAQEQLFVSGESLTGQQWAQRVGLSGMPGCAECAGQDGTSSHVDRQNGWPAGSPNTQHWSSFGWKLNLVAPAASTRASAVARLSTVEVQMDLHRRCRPARSAAHSRGVEVDPPTWAIDGGPSFIQEGHLTAGGLG